MIAEAGYYDVRLFIFGNERDLTARGYPTVRYPVSHMVPFVHAIRMVDGHLDGGAGDPRTDVEVDYSKL